jgi:hypothetical protein
MERAVVFQQNQLFASKDANNLTTFPRESLDHVSYDGIEPGMKFTGFTVVEDGPTTAIVGSGRLWKNGEVYFRDDEGGVELDLLSVLPQTAKLIVTVTSWAQTVATELEPRQFLLDPIARTTEARVTATESRRYANIDKQVGTESTDPQPPSLDANILAIAYITLGPTGIENIEMVEANRLRSAR